jgi:Cyclic nucleotide-binding domain
MATNLRDLKVLKNHIDRAGKDNDIQSKQPSGSAALISVRRPSSSKDHVLESTDASGANSTGPKLSSARLKTSQASGSVLLESIRRPSTSKAPATDSTSTVNTTEPKLGRVSSTKTVSDQSPSLTPSGSVLSFAESRARKSNASIASLRSKTKPAGFVKELSIKPEEDETGLTEPKIKQKTSVRSITSLKSSDKSATFESSYEIDPKTVQDGLAIDDTNRNSSLTQDPNTSPRRNSVLSAKSSTLSDTVLSFAESKARRSSISQDPNASPRRGSVMNTKSPALSDTVLSAADSKARRPSISQDPNASPRRGSVMSTKSPTLSDTVLSAAEPKASKSISRPIFESELSIKQEEDDFVPDDPQFDKPKIAKPPSGARKLSVLQIVPNPSTPPPERRRMSLAILQSKLASTRTATTTNQQISSKSKSQILKLFTIFKLGSRIQTAITLQMKTMLNRVRGVVKPTIAPPPTLTSILTSLSQSSTAYTPTLIRNLLAAKTRDIPQIVNILGSTLKDFKTFSKAEQAHLARHLRYDTLSNDQVLLWEEHLATCFYFIVSGSIDVFKLNNNNMLKLATMKAGSVFGHGRIKVDYARRSAAAYCIGEGVVLTIERDDFLAMKTEEIDERVLLLDGLSWFKDCSEKLKRFFKVEEFMDGVVQKEGVFVNRVYWVLEGQLKVIQSIPIVRRVNGKSSTERAWKDGMVLGENDSKVMVELQTKTIIFGNWFNCLVPCGTNKDTVKYLGQEYIEKRAFVDYYSTVVDDLAMSSSYAIVSDGKSVLASIAMEELCEFISKESIYNLTFKSDVEVYSVQELQERYLADQAWDAMKKETTKTVAKKK